MNAKTKKIIEDAERDGIPIFVLTAKDVLSTNTIKDYGVACISTGCSQEHYVDVGRRLVEFKQWQEANASKVKLPD